MMRDANLLLEYLTVLQRGTWQTFRTAALDVFGPDEGDAPRWIPSIVAENLSILGHVEFAFDTTLEWEVTPPCLVNTPGLGPGSGILVGGRLTDIISRLFEAAERLKIQTTQKYQQWGPPIIEFHASSEDNLETLAARSGITFDRYGGSRLVRLLPSITSMYASSPDANVPLGFTISRFDNTQTRWVTVERVDGDGSYRIEAYRPEYRVIRGANIKKVSRSVAVYKALQCYGRSVTTYISNSQEFVTPVHAKLPILYCRALVLLSGRLPDYVPNSVTLRFPSIPAEVANIIQRGIGEIGGTK